MNITAVKFFYTALQAWIICSGVAWQHDDDDDVISDIDKNLQRPEMCLWTKTFGVL